MRNIINNYHRYSSKYEKMNKINILIMWNKNGTKFHNLYPKVRKTLFYEVISLKMIGVSITHLLDRTYD